MDIQTLIDHLYLYHLLCGALLFKSELSDSFVIEVCVKHFEAASVVELCHK